MRKVDLSGVVTNVCPTTSGLKVFKALVEPRVHDVILRTNVGEFGSLCPPECGTLVRPVQTSVPTVKSSSDPDFHFVSYQHCEVSDIL